MNFAVDRRGTNSIKWDTVPDGVIPLSIADADWPTAPAVIDAVHAELERTPVFGYTRGCPEPIETVIAWYRRKYGLEVPAEWLMFIPGIVPALSTLSKLADGDVLTVTPNYSMLLAAPARAGKRMLRSPMIERSDGGALSYEWDYADLEAKSSGAGLLYICNPHNPIGRAYTRAELTTTADFAVAHDLITVSDEIHCEIVYGAAHTPWFDVRAERSVTLIAPGKICNMPGIPSAIAVIPDAKLRAQVRDLFGFSSVGALNAAAATGAFGEACDPWKSEIVEYLRSNRDYLEQELPRRLPKARFTRSEATYLQWLDLSAYELGGAAQYLLEHAKVALTGGADFGGVPDNARINFAAPRTVLTEALDRIEAALNERC